ncbi:hypothetical protein MGG_14610 [Pyricularia oryzae 70-15]|uniref:Uncharacterized protein n=2 Tax=Pyricularia oryzae TaxID=318829 RepID=G4MMU9_PYRO7|nr:uncharacterized protein MGG_14610 [Pyricularia oryzae 70-15]EHA56179.1 hypothetical protein MGG_14610 [Pyricularia oryzae 70-15]ELQ34017.1 hypothetical protein OOU_Y34scaffold00823g1 [Pyricularia oryzae Y34]
MENWLKETGAVGLDNLELADFPITGRGVRTLRHFKEGEKILTIPCGSLWTVEQAHADSLLGPALRSVRPPLSVEDILATYILFVRSRESGYDGLRSHVAALPSSYSSSIFFAEEELEVCAGTSLYTVTKQLEQRIEDDYRALVMRLLVQHRDLFPLEQFTIEDYKWALCTVWSRAMDFVLPGGNSIRLLAPFADMLNHSDNVKQCHAYDSSSKTLSVLAGKDYEAGDQLKLWASARLDPTSTISLTLTDPLPNDVLRYLRIQRSDASELAGMACQRIDAAEKISDSNEVEVLRFLVESLSGLLKNFGTQLEKLEEQLAEGVYASGGNAWAAAHVSSGEQRVLRLARKRAEDLLAAVESRSENGKGSLPAQAQCANCGKASVPLMLCARCRAISYCGRNCQVAHFSEHKVICRITASRNV